MTDRELFHTYQQRGEAAVFSQLVDRHAGSVYAACLRVLNDSHAAEDASQAVFLIFSQKAPSLPAGTVVAGWLYQTALGVASNARRMAARRERHEREAAAMKIQSVQENTDVSWEQLRPKLDTALAKLPEAQRDAIVLCFLEGRARDEAAAELGCPLKTLNSRVSLALEKLRAEFAAAGLTTSAALLTEQLSAHALGTAPAGLVGACLQSANAGAAAMAKSFLHVVFWTKVKAIALGLVALLVLAAAVPQVYRALAHGGAAGNSAAAAPAPGIAPDFRDDAPPPNPAPKKTAFVPTGGNMIVKTKLPPNLIVSSRIDSGLEWNADHSKLLFLTGVTTGKEACGYPIYTLSVNELDVATGKIAVRAGYAGKGGSAHWISGDRVLAEGDEVLMVFDAKGTATKISGLDRKTYSNPINLIVSPDGGHAAWYCTRADGSHHGYEVFVAAFDGSAAKRLAPPAPPPGAANLKLNTFPNGWSVDGRLKLNTSWSSGERFSADVDRRAWLYDPAAEKFEAERTDVLSPGSGFVEYAFREPQDNDALWQLPEQQRLRRVLAKVEPASDKTDQPAKPVKPVVPSAHDDPQKAPAAPRTQGTKKSRSAEALEVLDASGKVVKHIALDTNVLNGADVWPRLTSADGRFVLLSAFHQFKYEIGAPWSVWTPVRESEFVLDVKDEKLTALNLGELHWPRVGPVALMSLSQQLSVVDTEDTAYIGDRSSANKLHGVWSLPFGGKAVNLAAELGLPGTWAGHIVYPDTDFHHPALDRFALVTRPKAYLLEPGERQILIFMNSARPIRAFKVTTAGESPENSVWSPDGALFAFTFGGDVYVFEPTADGKEVPGPAKPTSDF